MNRLRTWKLLGWALVGAVLGTLVLAGTGLFYFAICYPISLYSRRLERTFQHD